MQISEVSIVELLPADYNPRRISAQQMQALERSMREFGVVDPFIVNADNTVIGGHQRLEAARRMGLETVPVVYVDLDKDREKALNLALNKISGEWDQVKLEELLAELQADDVDLALTGFSEEELAALLGGQMEAGLTDPDDVPEPPAEPTSKPGDLWLLGEHRVLCGDATVVTDVERLMGGSLAEMVWTDPPYGVAIGDKNKLLNAIGPSNRIEENLQNDTLNETDMTTMLHDAFAGAAACCLAGAAWYVAAPAGPPHVLFGLELKTLGIWRQTLQWVKNNATFAPMGVDYHWRAEPIFYGWVPGAAHRYHGGRKQDTVWEIDRPTKSPDHPTMKPVELVARAVENSSLRGQIVLDPFLGSGTTLIACEQLGRICYGMEISPVYVDVMVRRWEDFTGKKAVLDGNPRP